MELGILLDFLNMSCCSINNPFVFNIADVFILPGSSVNALVHPFFILANLVLTSVLLNVMIAFFVSAFVTKASQMDILIGSEVSERSILPLSRTGSLVSLTSRVYDDVGVNSEREVTVRLRQDFDRILRTVAGGMEEEDAGNAPMQTQSGGAAAAGPAPPPGGAA